MAPTWVKVRAMRACVRACAFRASDDDEHIPDIPFVSSRARFPLQEYVEKHGLQKILEEAANAVVKSKAQDPLEFLVSPLAPVELRRGGSNLKILT